MQTEASGKKLALERTYKAQTPSPALSLTAETACHNHPAPLLSGLVQMDADVDCGNQRSFCRLWGVLRGESWAGGWIGRPGDFPDLLPARPSLISGPLIWKYGLRTSRSASVGFGHIHSKPWHRLWPSLRDMDSHFHMHVCQNVPSVCQTPNPLCYFFTAFTKLVVFLSTVG